MHGAWVYYDLSDGPADTLHLRNLVYELLINAVIDYGSGNSRHSDHPATFTR